MAVRIRAAVPLLAALALGGCAATGGGIAKPDAGRSNPVVAPPMASAECLWFGRDEAPMAGTLTVEREGIRFTRKGGTPGDFVEYWRMARAVFPASLDAAELTGTWHTLAWVLFRDANGGAADQAVVSRVRDAVSQAIAGSTTTRVVEEPVYKPPWGLAEAAGRAPPRVAVVMSHEIPAIDFRDAKYGSLRNPDSITGSRAYAGADVGGVVGRAMGPSIAYPPFLALALAAMLLGAAVGGAAGAAEDAAVKSTAATIVASAPVLQEAARQTLLAEGASLERCTAASLQRLRLHGLQYTYATTAGVWRKPDDPPEDARLAALAGQGFTHAILLAGPPQVIVEHDPDPAQPRAMLTRFRLVTDVQYEIATLDRAYGPAVKPTNWPQASYRSEPQAALVDWTADDARRAREAFGKACEVIGEGLAMVLMRHFATEAASAPSESAPDSR